ncbi:MAG: ketopantoate reductase family protein [Spirochaetes bacterium]|nr:ketopantoate reductase family protein [Spirochaetota bacterium]
MKTAIWGAGALGTVLGAYLSKNNIDIDLISRNKLHIQALKLNGAKITGTVEMTVPVKAFLPEEVAGKYDIVFLMTKQTENTATVKSILPFLNADGIICTMQNGIPEISVAEIIGEKRTFGCAIEWGATLKDPGDSELTSNPDSISFSTGSFSKVADKNKLLEIKRILELMGPVNIEENFMGARWAKLIVNSSFSGMSAVTGLTFGEAAKNRNSRICIQKIIKECIDVAHAAGIKVEPIQGKDICKLLDYKNKFKQKFVYMILPMAIRKHKLLKASMLQDLEKGRKCEIDSINGIVSEYGRKKNIPTPYNDMVIKIIHEIEEGKYTPELKNLQLFRDLK